jgi:hypothetical protein
MDAPLHPLGATLSPGLTAGILTVITQASFATLHFYGPLAPWTGLGFQMALGGAVIIGVVLALAGSNPGSVRLPMSCRW